MNNDCDTAEGIMIFLLSKSPVPLTGRIGARKFQDWYRAAQKAAQLFKEYQQQGIRAHILVVTNFCVPGEGSEEECYLAVLACELEISPADITVIRKGVETIRQLYVASVYARRRGMKLLVVHTFTHGLRVRYLLSAARLCADLKSVWGIPRINDLAVDPALTILFPIIDLLGKRKNFLDWLKRKRARGKL